VAWMIPKMADCGGDQRKSRQDRKRKQRQSTSEGIIKNGTWVVDWCSGLTSRLGLWLGRGTTGLISRSALFSVVEKMSVCTACVWALVYAQHC